MFVDLGGGRNTKTLGNVTKSRTTSGASRGKDWCDDDDDDYDDVEFVPLVLTGANQHHHRCYYYYESLGLLRSDGFGHGSTSVWHCSNRNTRWGLVVAFVVVVAVVIIILVVVLGDKKEKPKLWWPC